MEKRRGVYHGIFTDFIYNECSKNAVKFKRLTLLSNAVTKRQEYEELILRYFAFVDNYDSDFNDFKVGVGKTLDDYLKEKNLTFSETEKNEKLLEFNKMIDFVEKVFPFGFSKKFQQPVSRVYFEAVAIGVTLALRSNPNLQCDQIDVTRWFENRSFKNNIFGRSRTHSPQKIKSRIDFVKEKLLEAQK
jgi:hypothetical protein